MRVKCEKEILWDPTQLELRRETIYYGEAAVVRTGFRGNDIAEVWNQYSVVEDYSQGLGLETSFPFIKGW